MERTQVEVEPLEILSDSSECQNSPVWLWVEVVRSRDVGRV
jgi:hypothetical protein